MLVPPSKGFNDERLAGYALNAAVGEMSAVFGGYPHLNRGSSRIGSAVDNGFLGWGNHADIERHLPSVDPVSDVYVRRARLGVEDKARHFLGWVQRRMLSRMSATLQSVVVMAVHRVVTLDVAVLIAVERSAFTGIENRTETIAHGNIE